MLIIVAVASKKGYRKGGLKPHERKKIFSY